MQRGYTNAAVKRADSWHCMQRHQALQKANRERAPALFTIRLSTVLGIGMKVLTFYAARRLYRVLRNSPMVYMQPVMFGFVAGLIYRWKVHHRRCAVKQDHQMLLCG